LADAYAMNKAGLERNENIFRFTDPKGPSFGNVRADSLERFPIPWNHVIEKESLRIKKLEHVRIEKIEQLFRDML